MIRQVTELAAAEGLRYDLERAVAVNTIDAHRLSHLAEAHGLGAEMHERLLRAHLGEGEAVDDPDTLRAARRRGRRPRGRDPADARRGRL
ncbi:DsbA family protein [Streptomyces sp. NPDC007901]|uniref:DsbA family protein n=1 Tax=Streptomyces sp. NPDC007901 TaxID=3364785 RepID=UPI0036EF8DC5